MRLIFLAAVAALVNACTTAGSSAAGPAASGGDAASADTLTDDAVAPDATGQDSVAESDTCGAACADPCAGLTCDVPPGPCYAAVGTCASGACSYAPLTGAACDDGNPCTVSDSCASGACAGTVVTCDAPPAAVCLDDQTLRVFAAPGVCSADGCAYASADVPCPSGCVSGACTSELCAGVTCNSPPGPCYAATGTCSDGQCSYPLLDGASCTDDDPCTSNDLCDSGACVGQANSCLTPPVPGCQDADTLLVWSKNGACGPTGACEYTQTAVACPGGCDAAKCVGDPCVGVTCTSPPGPCFDAAGTCDNGVCGYAPLTGGSCDDGKPCTTGDSCQSGTCVGATVVCDASPPSECIDGATLRTYAAFGACGNGTCQYALTDKTCALGCEAGACVTSACAGVVCDEPPTPCHLAQGTCDAGVCTYGWADGATCDDGGACTVGDVCTSGVCVGAPATCDSPPAPSCSAGVLTTYAAVGSCSAAGGCTYTQSQLPCALGCDGAGCKGDPCANVVCDTPPAATCVGATLQKPTAAGTCVAGECTYATTPVTCPFGCASGVCSAPPAVVIAEVLYDAIGQDKDVFVELKGLPGTPLTGLTLVGINGNDGVDYQPVALTGVIPPDGLFVVAHPQAAAWIADQADQTSLSVDYQNGPDSIALRSGSVVLDAVGYGVFTGSIFGGEGAPCVDPASGQSIVRAADGTDTDDNSADFTASAAPSPGAPNGAGCLPGELFCDGACVDPLTSDTFCGANACTAAPCSGGATCVAGTCVIVCSPACTGTDLCVAGVCQKACVDVCTPGATNCAGSQKLTCVTDNNGCAVWGAPLTCQAGQACQAGICTATCSDACVAGETRCQGALVQTCEPSAAGCLNWSTGTACGSGQSCTSAGLCGLVISTSRELCGELVVAGPVTIQGGAVVTCATGSLTIRAKEIFVDPASSIDLSATSDEASGQGWAQCGGNCNMNGSASGSSGGGNGTAGAKGNSTKYSYKDMGEYCGGGAGWNCALCAGPLGGAVRGTSHTLEATRGGRGGDGCKGPYAVTGVCTASALLPGGLGGGALTLIAESSVRIFGTLRADGADGTAAPTLPRVGASGGAGGTVLIAAPKVTVTGTIQARGGAGADGSNYEYYCGSMSNPGGDGGQGRIKIAHGKDPILTGTLDGAVTSESWLAPTRFHSPGIPVAGQPIHPTFTTLAVAWEAPYPEAAGYYSMLSTSATIALTPQNGAFSTASEVVLTPQNVAGSATWYLHVVTVHDGGQVGALQGTFPLTFITQPVQVSSSSHPSQTTWYPIAGQAAITANWSPPSGVTAAAYSGYWVRLDRATVAPPLAGGSGWTWTTSVQTLFTKTTDGQGLSAGAYYVHVIGVDQAGNHSQTAGARQVLLGSTPAKTTFYGYVNTSAGNGVSGATVSLQPFGLTATTDTNGYFLIDGVYEATYTVTLTKGAVSSQTTLAISAATSPWTTVFTGL